ncbi:MAG: hypothetical protein DWQ10_15435 [Calditrichaeota bacterium]|nr:MAG: hypothetical protein DWQ10_15435 [Calditrichota bacterium]
MINFMKIIFNGRMLKMGNRILQISLILAAFVILTSCNSDDITRSEVASFKPTNDSLNPSDWVRVYKRK